MARWCRLVAETLRIPVDTSDLLLARPSDPPVMADAVVVHPGAAHGARRWPAERFAEVVAWAKARGLTPVVTGTDAERGLASAVALAAGLGDGAVLAGRLSLVELAALVASARMVVSGDTGVSHLATAYRTPSVTLFGPTPPQLWGPPPDPRHVTLWNGAGRGDPFAATVDPALLTIDVAQVTAAAEQALAAVPA